MEDFIEFSKEEMSAIKSLKRDIMKTAPTLTIKPEFKVSENKLSIEIPVVEKILNDDFHGSTVWLDKELNILGVRIEISIDNEGLHSFIENYFEHPISVALFIQNAISKQP